MNYSGMKVLVMGLGLHGGGLESASYMARHGAAVTVTDLRDEKALAPSIERLDAACAGFGVNAVHYVLGRHETADFENADMVIKNPGVPADSPFLRAARRVETDISLFLYSCPAWLAAVTGSKGKSGTASALYHALEKAREGPAPELAGKAYLGGNITVSPLTFLDELKAGDDVVLELSSWQLGDLKGRLAAGGFPLLKPRAAVLTAIMPDHLDRYSGMDAYVADKRLVYGGQDKNDFTVAGDDIWGRSFLAESSGRPLVYSRAPLAAGVSGGWLAGNSGPGFARFCENPPGGFAGGETFEIVPERPLVPGLHQKTNLLAAGLACAALGLGVTRIRESMGTFPGIEHRLEFFHEANGVRYYNDSAATIPEAAAAAIDALCAGAPLVLVTGGTDKNLDFSPLVNAAPRAKAIILLEGSGSAKLAALFDGRGIAYSGPFDSVEKAVREAAGAAAAGDSVVLSPGCTSFGMFLNEFDRGRKWKNAVVSFA